MKPILGVMGGMGALASAEFVKTVYEHSVDDVEQDSPAVILYSDPAFPDRTQAFLNGRGGAIAELLALRLEELEALNAAKVVLCCVTLHYTLPMLTERLRSRVISLITVALGEVVESKRRHLLLCSTGARASGVFQNHELWPLAESYIAQPDAEDQEIVHRALYEYKVDPERRPLASRLKDLLCKYECESFIAGCSELHIMTKQLMKEGDEYSFIDPLLTIAVNLPSFLNEESKTYKEAQDIRKRPAIETRVIDRPAAGAVP